MASNLDDLLRTAASLSIGAGAPSAPSVSFASPIAAAGAVLARMEGVSEESPEGTGDSKRVYPVVLIRGLDRSTCFGSVGVGNASFCIRTDCKVKAHVLNKVPGFDESAFFIARVVGATVFAQPSVREDQVPASVQVEWREKMWSLPRWVREFQAVTIADDATATNEDIREESKFLAEAELFRTPSKKRKGGDKGEDLLRPLSAITIPAHQRALPEVGSSELEALIAQGSPALDRGGLARIVSRLESSSSGLSKSIGEIAEVTEGRLGEAEASVVMVSGAFQNLKSAIGPAMEMDTKFEAPTLWGTTSFLGDELVKLAVDMDRRQLLVEAIQTSLTGVEGRLTQFLEVERPDADSKIHQIVTFVVERLETLNPELAQMKTQMARIEAGWMKEAGKLSKRQKVKQGSVPVVSPANGMDYLLARLRSDPSGKGLELFPEDSDFPMDTEEDEDSHRVESEVARIMATLSVLMEEVGVLKASAEDRSIKFGGLGFRSLQECNSWIEANLHSLRYALFMDPLLMLDRIFGSDDLEADSQFKILETRVKLKITTGSEAAAIKALHFNRPRLFHKGRVPMTSERNTSKLSKLPKFKDWKSAGEGVRNYITKQMNQIYSTVNHDIVYALGGDPKLVQAQSIATLGLNATVTFITQLLGFIDTLYEKLHLHSRFTSEQAWALTTQILDRVCEDLYASKEGVAAAMTVEDPSSICAHMLWSCFRTHDVMSVYVDHNFENHPAITAEYVKFLATNSGYDKVEKLDVDVKQMKDDVKKALEISGQVAKKAADLTDKLSAANKDLGELKRKVSSMEGKNNK